MRSRFFAPIIFFVTIFCSSAYSMERISERILPTKTHGNMGSGEQKYSEIITYQLAEDAHLQQILALCAAFTAEDHYNLLLPPALDRQEVFAGLIAQRKLSVAVNQSGQVVGFCKIYIVGVQELLNILCDEFRAVDVERSGYKYKMHAPADKHSYVISYSQLNNAIRGRLPFLTNGEKLPDYQLSIGGGDSLYIYAGTFYIYPAYRNQHVGSALEHAALNFLTPDIEAAILDGVRNIYYLHGVVKANESSQGRLRSIATYVYDIFSREETEVTHVTINVHRYNTVKPMLHVVTVHPETQGHVFGGEDITHDHDTSMERIRQNSIDSGKVSERPASPSKTTLVRSRSGKGLGDSQSSLSNLCLLSDIPEDNQTANNEIPGLGCVMHIPIPPTIVEQMRLEVSRRR